MKKYVLCPIAAEMTEATADNFIIASGAEISVILSGLKFVPYSGLRSPLPETGKARLSFAVSPAQSSLLILSMIPRPVMERIHRTAAPTQIQPQIPVRSAIFHA